MCGIAGFLRTDGGPAEALAPALDAMVDRVASRGPDARGTWFDGPLALGHRRLSIIDVSDAGRQPMVSQCGRYAISYNGELYNFPDLRQAYLTPRGIEPRSGTDTEVLLEVLAVEGLERALARFNGMFAFALWDRRERRLHLVRDRLGIKPLYWARRGPYVFFGSQLGSFAEHPAWTNDLSDAGIWDFLHYTNIGEDRSAFAECWKVAPGGHIAIDSDGRSKKRPFFDLADCVRRRGQWCGSYEDAVVELDSILKKVVHDQSRADVPLGAFLSGGVDSSTVVALLRQDRPVHSFSIGYEDAAFDESADARAVAQHLGTEHTEFVLRPKDAVDVIPDLATIYDEPFADPSQIPTTIVSRLARQAVTVALSGDGGDELFAGYERYERSAAMWRHAERVPRPLRRMLAWGIGCVPPEVWRSLLKPFLADAGQSMPFYSALLRDASVSAYQERVNNLGVGAASTISGDHAATVERLFDAPPETDCALDTLLYVDQRRRLPDSMLTKVDRASMSCSLEIRVPLLDNRVLDFAWSVPVEFLIRSGRKKAVLRDVLARYVPPSLFERPKKGFHVPLRDWLAGPLRDWAESLLQDRLAAVPGYLNESAVRAIWQRYLAGDQSMTHPIWVVLMFLAWQQSLRRPAAG